MLRLVRASLISVICPASGLINRIFFGAADKIDKIVVALDSTEIWNRPTELNKYIENLFNNKVPNSSYYVIDPSENGYSGDSWNISQVNDFRYEA